MTARKERLTVTVDRNVVRAGQRAVSTGSAASLSAWVNIALTEHAAREQRLRAMADAIAAFETEFGAISDAEMLAQERADRRAAIVVRDQPRRSPTKARRRGAA